MEREFTPSVTPPTSGNDMCVCGHEALDHDHTLFYWGVGDCRSCDCTEPNYPKQPKNVTPAMQMESNPKHSLNFAELRRANIIRNEEVFNPCNNWSLMEWACAMAGEAGELCGAIKKMRRMEEGTNSAKDPTDLAIYKRKVADEMADVIIYLDLMASKMNLDLGQAVISKFNEVSDRMKSTTRL